MKAACARLGLALAPLAAAAAIALVLLATGLGVGLERMLAESRDSFRAATASGDVHIVEIDARSIEALRRWPWPRSLHGAAVDRLREAGARSIAFDIDFSSASTAAEDAAFAAALARAGGGVVLPTFIQQSAYGREESIDSAPIPDLADNAFLATANVLPDADGALRRMPFGGETLGMPRPSLASMIAERTERVGDSFGIDFAIDPATIPRHSFVDLIEGRVPMAALAGKRVIVGSTAVELGDHYAVPHHGMLPGVVIQALAAETLIAGSERREGGALAPLALALAIVAAALLRPGRAALAALVLSAVALPPLSLLADLRFALTYEIVPAVAALLAAGVVSAAALRRRRERESGLRDPATGLPNLRALVEDAAGLGTLEIVVARIGGHAALGSALGPEAMAKLAVALAERLRLGSGAARVYRCDEAAFAWIAFGDVASASLDGLAALARDQEVGGRRIELPLHFGLAAGLGGDAPQLAADAALAASQAERSGLRVQRFTERDSAEVERSVALMGELDSAFRSGEIRNHYQPKLDLASGRIASVEALVRWFHPDRGLLPPDSFVPLIEEAGRARDLTRHVLSAALSQALHWREQDGLELSVAVNVSAGLLADAPFMAELRETVQSSGLPAAALTLEVTESAAMADPESSIAALEAWRSLGAGVSIDDFGTGQSSLGYIRTLPATELKIDRSFVSDLGRTPRNAIMVRSTIAMAHELGLTVVAEGVEEEGCLAALAAMGCDVVQGWLIGRAVAGDEIPATVRNLEIGLPACAAAAG